MKLKETFVIEKFADEYVLVETGDNAFHGIIRGNATAAFIVNCLQLETTREEIIAAMTAKYDAADEEIAESVDDILGKLRSVGALVE